MEYKVKVVEVFELERYYFVEAKNKAEAKKLAKNDDWYDAQDIQSVHILPLRGLAAIYPIAGPRHQEPQPVATIVAGFQDLASPKDGGLYHFL